MTGFDLLPLFSVGGIMLSSAISVSCILARNNMRAQRDEAREVAANWKKKASEEKAKLQTEKRLSEEYFVKLRDLRIHHRTLTDEFAAYRRDEPARFEAERKARLKAMGDAGRAAQAAKRAALKVVEG